ncbi:DUF4192 family protein [Brevibacterium otitidis]|uniref:DUF4192 family protein n=1 Tax=Brevibacterium otitidis TaxID=53364 RepID=A0ABV5X7E6_9MICO|nr:hypothetical protein GCM10023233_09850 [Brevibacterium otitidis]
MKDAPEEIATEIISTVPYLLEYQPTDSLVLVTFDRGESTITFGPALRIDFTAEAVSDCTEEALLTPVCALRRVTATECAMPVLFCDEKQAAVLQSRLPDSTGAERSAFAQPLDFICEALHCAGFETFRPWWVSPFSYGTFDGRAQVGFVPQLASTRAVQQLTLSNGAPHASFSAAAALPACDVDTERAIDAARAAGHHRSDLHDAWLAEALRYADLVESGEHHDLQALPQPDPLAVLGLEDLCAQEWGRDAVQMLVCFEHSAFLPEDMRLLDPGEFGPYAEAVAPLAEATADVPGISERRPDARRTHYGIMLLKMMATYVSMDHLPAVLALIAWMEWSVGRASFAQRFARNALSFDSEHKLAHLVDHAVESGTLPGWAKEPHVPGEQVSDDLLATASEAQGPEENAWQDSSDGAGPMVLGWDDPPVLEG